MSVRHINTGADRNGQVRSQVDGNVASRSFEHGISPFAG